jgi:2-polyprenyl-3-methyl-5-hydroxy-6-metoxy-1,4-benzoquinol methylase
MLSSIKTKVRKMIQRPSQLETPETVLGVTLGSFKEALPYGSAGQRRTRYKQSYTADIPRWSFKSNGASSLKTPLSQLCTADQFQEPVYSELCAEIHEPPRLHRKQWEFAYILQVLKKHGKLKPGSKGLGFGCGREPLPAAFCKYGCSVLATDLDQESGISKGWRETSQYTGNLDELFEASRRIVDKKTFYEQITYKEVDMNSVPAELHGGFDFVWSACSLEHLGSLQNGINFIYSSLRCLKPGGVAVHTTEFNLSSDSETVENSQVCLYREKDILQTISALPEGFSAVQLNLDTGRGEIDKYVDVPPYLPAPHLKMLLERFVTTSIGLIFTRRDS